MINSMVKTVLKNVTIKDILEAINKKYGTKSALRIYAKDGSLREISYLKLGRRVVTIASALINLGIKKDLNQAEGFLRLAIWQSQLFAFLRLLSQITKCGIEFIPLRLKAIGKAQI